MGIDNNTNITAIRNRREIHCTPVQWHSRGSGIRGTSKFSIQKLQQVKRPHQEGILRFAYSHHDSLLSGYYPKKHQKLHPTKTLPSKTQQLWTNPTTIPNLNRPGPTTQWLCRYPDICALTFAQSTFRQQMRSDKSVYFKQNTTTLQYHNCTIN